MFEQHYQGKRVFVTGHTGFKGSWLCEWLLQLGAEVIGYSLPPPTNPALFHQLELAPRLRHLTGDIRDAGSLQHALVEARPDFVFLDLGLPDMSGFDVVEEIEKDSALKGLRIVILTAKDLTPVETARLDARVEAVIQKWSMSLPDILRDLKSRLCVMAGGGAK